MNDGKRQVTDETEPDENPIATIHYENGTELTGKAVTLQDGTVGVRIPGEFFKTALLPIANTEHISSRMRPLSFFDAFMYSSLNLRVTCRFVAMLILSSIRQAKQDRYRSRSFPMRHHYALRAQKT